MRNLTIIFVIMLFLPIPCNGLEITLLPESEVTTSVVTLGDIATFSEESALSQALSSRHISTAPSLSKKLTITKQTVIDKLHRQLDDSQQLQWNGSLSTVVTRQSIRITATDMKNSIQEFLIDQVEDLPVAEYSFAPRQLPLPFLIPTGTLDLTVIPSDPNIIGSKRFLLVYKVNNKVIKNISIRGTLKAMAPVAVLSQSVRRNTIIQPGMVEMRTKNLSELRSPCTNLQMVLGKKLIKSQRSGSVLDISHIEFPPVVHKGQLVKMIVQQNGLHLTATGMASMDGKQDQVIRVKNLRSNKNVYCKVSSPGIVEVQI
jgi:flagella basal body P-ring formation protein FlgA